MLLGLPAAAFACLTLAPSPDRPRIYVEGYAGKSIIFLGSEDHRKAQGFGIGVDLYAPRRFRYRQIVPRMIVEGYYHRSTSPGASQQPANGTDAYGVLALIRYEKGLSKNLNLYFDWGMGLQYSDQRTVDLSGRLSSTPTFGGGFAIHQGEQTYFLGVRYFHISNAGLQGNNQGQNQLLLTLGVRF